MVTININERTKAGKTLLELAKILATTNNGVTISDVLNNSDEKNVAKKLSLKQKSWINRLKKVKDDIDLGKFEGNSIEKLMNEL